MAEWVILREMFEQQETTPSHIATLTGLTRGAVSKLIDRLLEKKLVLREISQTDRRYQSIRLTSKAVQLVPQLAKLADRNDHEFFSGLSTAEQKELTRLLQKVAESNTLNTVPIS